MYRFDRIGTPRIHGGNIALTSDGGAVAPNANATTNLTFLGNAVNAVPGSIASRDALHWDASLTLPIGNKFFVGQQFTLTKKGADNSLGLELTGSLHCVCSDFIETIPMFCELAAAGGTTLAAVTAVDQPTFLLPTGVQRAGTTQRARAMSYATPLNLVSPDAGGTYIHGFLFSGQDAAAGTINRMHLRFAFRTAEPDPNTRDFDIRR